MQRELKYIRNPKGGAKYSEERSVPPNPWDDIPNSYASRAWEVARKIAPLHSNFKSFASALADKCGVKVDEARTLWLKIKL